MAEGSLHLIKLASGCGSPEQLAAWQAERKWRFGRVFHRTRMMPRRRAELLAGGSIYWVIRGLVQVRQRLLDIEPTQDEEGGRRTLFIVDAELVRTQSTPWRIFQGWRYLAADDAPSDRRGGLDRPSGFEEMPDPMYDELRELGLV
jgi:hypothetical protein